MTLRTYMMVFAALLAMGCRSKGGQVPDHPPGFADPVQTPGTPSR